MRTAFLGMAIPIVCLLATFCYAQSTSGFQSVGGDFGQDWISSFKVQNFRLADQNPKNDLWIWGGAPKGSIIVNGRLVADPYYFWKSLNYTRGWLGRVWVDPRTGYPIYAYIEPHTRRTMYFYVDPYTQSRSILMDILPLERHTMAAFLPSIRISTGQSSICRRRYSGSTMS